MVVGPVVVLAVLIAARPTPVVALPSACTNVEVFHRSGQSFVTWDEVSGGSTAYNVFRDTSPITSVAGFTPLGMVGQNTTLNSRAKVAEGVDSLPYRIVQGVDLSLTAGLFVHTTETTGEYYYAVTSVDSTGENTTVIPGQNATSVALPETLRMPQPVLQRTVMPGNGRSYDIYVHWTSNTGTTLYPAMCVVPSKAFTFLIVRQGAGALHPLLVGMHAYGGNYYGSPSNPITGTGYPGEWVLSPDDVLENDIKSSMWYGYHEGFDWQTGQPVPTSGTNVDYTQRRVVYAFDWALTNLPVDPNRVYCSGWSMGGTGTAFIGHALRDRVAARQAFVPKLDLSFLTEVVPSDFNPGYGHRVYCNRRWGTVATNLMSSDGVPVYDRLNYAFLVEASSGEDLPQTTFFAGRNDRTVGWGEKIAPVMAMLGAKQPFVFFWDSRTHAGTDSLREWSPMQYLSSWLYDCKLNESLPAFSNCSADDDLGDGDPTTADQYGTINGYLTWDKPPADEVDAWEVVVRNRDLLSIYGTEFAPAFITVDVTPRRLQAFTVTPGVWHSWTVRDATTGALIASGLAMPDSNGLLTVPGVAVADNGARVTISGAGTAVASASTGVRAGVHVFPNPAFDMPNMQLSLSRDARIRIEVLDVTGRRLTASPLLSFPRGSHVVKPQDAGLGSMQAIAPGVYFYRVTGLDADALGATRSGRWVLVR